LGPEKKQTGRIEKAKAEAALAAGIFHRKEVPIEAVKKHMR
jgi:imidazole glycerol phosphate synthase subunit HisF